MITRTRNTLPDDIAGLLAERQLRGAYDERPAYQQNDYLGWIGRAKTAATRDRRITLMVDELAQGGVYMGMDHAPSRKRRDGE